MYKNLCEIIQNAEHRSQQSLEEHKAAAKMRQIPWLSVDQALPQNDSMHIQISQEGGQVVWYSHIFNNFPQFIVIHTVKGFGIVNKAEIDVFYGTLLLFP